MQYTSKIALLAVALFGTSALAAPFGGEAGYDVEAREVDNELSAREYFEMYLEARANPALDARDLESLDFEAREYLDYLEAREVAAAATEPPQPLQPPQTPLKPQSTHVETAEHTHGDHETTSGHSESKSEVPTFLTPHQKAVRQAKKLAAKEFEDPKVYHAALADKEDKLHKFAVLKFLKKPAHLKKALNDEDSPYHKAAKRIVHRRKAKVYLSIKSNLKKALKHKHHKYHKDAVKVYFSHGEHFEHALSNKKSPFHKAAVHEYLLDKKTRKSILADPTDPLFKAAKKLQKKLNKEHHHTKLSGGPSGNSTITTPPSKA